MITKRLTTILLSILIALSFMPGYAFAEGESSDVNDQDLTEATEGAEVQEATALVQEDSANNDEDKASDVTKGDTSGARGGAEIIDSGTCGDNLTWSLDSDGLLTISGEGNMYDYRNNEWAPWYSNKDAIKEVKIENGVTSIGDFAFYDCSSITSITIPEGVTSIGASAFLVCSRLTSITIPDGVTSIGDYAFNRCGSLISITIPEGVTSIGEGVFTDCYSLISITIPEGVTSIGEYAFYMCGSLISITIPEGVTSIGDFAFYDCISLTSITIPEGVTSIGMYAFATCNSLTSITIPDSVTSVGGAAFENCSSLTSITIPDGVTSIGARAFRGCDSLNAVNINDISAWCNIQFYDYDSTPSRYNLFLNGELVTDLVIPDGFESIGAYTFEGCRSLTSITIPDSVTSIGEYAFYGCSSLISITIPDGVTSIGASAFCYCSNLSSITIPDGVTSIGAYAFQGCSSLTSITIPEGVTIIGNQTFRGCNSLTSITIPEGVTIIGNQAFYNCSSLTSITIPEGVTIIGGQAFYKCSSLTSVTIPDSVTSIGINAFDECSNLQFIFYEGTEQQWDALGINPSGIVHYSATDHTYGEWSLKEEPTCTEEGSKKKTCTVCEYSVTEEIPINPEAHAWGNWELTTAPTCSTAGEETRTCQHDATHTDKRSTDIDPEAHAWGDWTVTKAATCVEGGEETRYCGIDPSHFQKRGTEVDSEAHVWGEWADCGDGNNHQRVCSYSDEHIDTKAHEWNNGEITTPATCGTAGTKTFTCTACGSIKTEEVAPTGEHTVEEWTVTQSATCVATGTRVGECTVCHETITETIPVDPEAHDWNEPEWTWSGDHSVANAKFTCKNDSTHVESIDAEVTSAEDDTGDSIVYTAKATFSGKEYTKTITEEKIKRIYGTSRYDTAIKAADEYKAATGSKFENVVVAYGKNFPDALSGGYLAKVKNAPILLVEPKQEDRIADYISENIASGGRVYILGGEGAVSTSFEDKVKARGILTRRLGGATRYETNLLILKAAGVTDQDILVCTGGGYADSLSASAVGKPILLVGNTLTYRQMDYIRSLNSQHFYLIGGEGAVSASIETVLRRLGYSNVERISGASRYETSTEVAKKFFPSAKTVVLAYAQNFPDGLSGGPLAMKKSAPIILTDSNKTGAAAKYVKETGAVSSITLGGSSLISDIAVTAIMGQVQ